MKTFVKYSSVFLTGLLTGAIAPSITYANQITISSK